MSEEPQVAHKIGEGELKGQLPERRRETHGRLMASFLATNPGAKFSLQAAASGCAANTLNTELGAWTVQQYDQAKGIYVDRLTTDSVTKAYEMFQRGPDFRVLDNKLNDFAADYEGGRPIYHERSQFNTEHERTLQATVDVLAAGAEDQASLPWVVVPTQADHGKTLTIQDANGGTVVRTFGVQARDYRDAYRIQACVSACVGLPTHALAGRRLAEELFLPGAGARSEQDESDIDPAGALTASLLRASRLNGESPSDFDAAATDALLASNLIETVRGWLWAKHSGASVELAEAYVRDALVAAMPSVVARPQTSGGELPTTPGQIGIRLEGGVIQSIFTDRPMDVTVIDYDTEDRDEKDRLFDMPQKDGETSQCVIHEYPAAVMPDECRRIRDALAAEEPEGMSP